MDLKELHLVVDSTLKQEIHIKEIHDNLNKLLDVIPDLNKKRTDCRIVELVCQYVENYAKNKKYAIDKKQIVIEFLKRKFNLDNNEIDNLAIQIERDLRHGIIKKATTSQVVKKCVINFIKKKVF